MKPAKNKKIKSVALSKFYALFAVQHYIFYLFFQILSNKNGFVWRYYCR